jgi:hypothetical protein
VHALIKQRIKQLKNNSRQHVSPHETTHEQAGCNAPQLAGPMLQSQRQTRRPHAAHSNAEQRAECKEHGVVNGQAAQQAEERNPQDGQHQHGFSTEAVGRRANSKSTDQPEYQRSRAESSRESFIDRKTMLNIEKQKGEDREIEAVEEPPKKSGEEGAPLRKGQISE